VMQGRKNITVRVSLAELYSENIVNAILQAQHGTSVLQH
jgi:hypothetical protein